MAETLSIQLMEKIMKCPRCKEKPIYMGTVKGFCNEPAKECPKCGCVWVKDEKGVHILN